MQSRCAALGVLLAGALSGAAARAQDAGGELVALLHAHASPEEQGRLDADLRALASAGVDLAPLAQRLREGRAKRVPEPRIAQALVAMLQRYRQAAAALAPCPPRLPAPQRQHLLAQVDDLLASGVPGDTLLPTLGRLCQADDAIERLGAAAELYFALREHARAGAAPAWGLAGLLAAGRLDRAGARRLQVTIQDIAQSGADVDRVLVHTAARLASGLSARAVRAELEERYRP